MEIFQLQSKCGKAWPEWLLVQAQRRFSAAFVSRKFCFYLRAAVCRVCRRKVQKLLEAAPTQEKPLRWERRTKSWKTFLISTDVSIFPLYPDALKRSEMFYVCPMDRVTARKWDRLG